MGRVRLKMREAGFLGDETRCGEDWQEDWGARRGGTEAVLHNLTVSSIRL
jgi:hypothetical protein